MSDKASLPEAPPPPESDNEGLLAGFFSSDGPLAAIGREDLVDHVELVQLLMIEPHSYYLLGQV